MSIFQCVRLSFLFLSLSVLTIISKVFLFVEGMILKAEYRFCVAFIRDVLSNENISPEWRNKFENMLQKIHTS